MTYGKWAAFLPTGSGKMGPPHRNKRWKEMSLGDGGAPEVRHSSSEDPPSDANATFGPSSPTSPSPQLSLIMHVYIMVTYNSAVYIQPQISLCAHKILTLESRLLQKCL